jgi:hypothetical protein
MSGEPEVSRGSESVPRLEPVAGPGRQPRRRAIVVAAGVAAILTLVVVLGRFGAPSDPVAIRPSARPDIGPSAGRFSPTPLASASDALGFVLPRGFVLVDQIHRAAGSSGQERSIAPGKVPKGPHHLGIVGRCRGPGSVEWEIGPEDQTSAVLGTIACDGNAQGTGTVTDSPMDSFVLVSYDAATEFRLVVVLIPD